MVSEKVLNQIRKGDVRSMNLSFAGCGFLGIYHVGVASCFKEYAPHLVVDQISGASAGAIAACGLICGCDLGKATTHVLGIALQARQGTLGPFRPSFNIVDQLHVLFDVFLPKDAYLRATGRLNISLTRVSDRKNILVNQFDSNEDLVQALICSAFVPFYCGVIPPKYKGTRYVDGGLSDNIPIIDGDTVTVSPFAGESDICPDDLSATEHHVLLANTSIQFTMGNLYRLTHALFPPNPEVLSNMCQQGFDDALKFLQRNNLLNCTKHLSILSSITSEKPLEEEESEEEEECDEEEVNEDDSTISEGFFDDPEFEADCDSHCPECTHRKHVALVDSLPPSVVNALEAACDSVNSGLLSGLYNLKAYRVVSLMAQPWVVPVEVMYILVKKFFKWAPYMPDDMQWFVKEFAHTMKDVYEFVQQSRHRYSARFTCQLAITEMAFDIEDGKHHHRSLPPSYTRHRAKRTKSSRPRQPPPRQRNLNVGFSVDFKSCHQSPLRAVDELRHHILEEEAHGELVIEDETKMKSRAEKTEGSTEDDTHVDVDTLHASYDTFENCLHITQQMDAVLSYYYAEENDPKTIKVAEIFSLHGNNPNQPVPSTSYAPYFPSTSHHKSMTPRNSPKSSPLLSRRKTKTPHNSPMQSPMMSRHKAMTSYAPPPTPTEEMAWDNLVEYKDETVSSQAGPSHSHEAGPSSHGHSHKHHHHRHLHRAEIMPESFELEDIVESND